MKTSKGRNSLHSNVGVLIGLSVLSLIFVSYVGAQDPVGYWSFDVIHDPVAADDSGNSNDGTIVGARWTAEGRHGGALRFFRDDDEHDLPDRDHTDRVTIPHSDSLNITGDLTVELWFKLEEDEQHGNVITKWESGGEIPGNNSWILHIAYGKLQFGVSADGNQDSMIYAESGALECDRWYHAAATHNILGESIKLYLDGFLEGSVPYTEGIYGGDSKIHIGQYGITGALKSLIDEVKIYNRALDALEIAGNAGLLVHTQVDYSPWPEQDPRVVITPMPMDSRDSYILEIIITKNDETIYRYEDTIPSASFELDADLPEDVSLLTVRVRNGHTEDIEQESQFFLLGSRRKILKELLYFSFYSPEFCDVNETHIDALNESPYDAYNISTVKKYRRYVPVPPDYSAFIDNVHLINDQTEKHIWPLVFFNDFVGCPSPEDAQARITPACDPDGELYTYFSEINTMDIYDDAGAIRDFLQVFSVSLRMARDTASPGVYVDPEAYNCYKSYEVEYLAEQHGRAKAEIEDQLKSIGHRMADCTNRIYPEAIIWFYFIDFGNRRSITYIAEGILERAKERHYSLKVVDGNLGDYLYFSLEHCKERFVKDYIAGWPFKQEYPNFHLGSVVAPYLDIATTREAEGTTGWMRRWYDKYGDAIEIRTIEHFTPIFEFLFTTSEYVWIYGAGAAGDPVGYDEYHDIAGEYDDAIREALLRTPCDLVVTEISVNESHQVVVIVENLGRGRVPDYVWTDHTDISVYIYVDGEGWGGSNIWRLDPARGLREPGGTVVYTSELVIGEKATIIAAVDLHDAVTEADEENNSRTAVLYYEPGPIEP